MKSRNPLLDLKNIGNTSAHWLNAIGIKEYEELATMGAAEAYIRIENKGIRVSKVLLYALQGALLNTHWNDLEPSLKQQLLDDVAEIKARSSVS
jgi:DNA transformation protein